MEALEILKAIEEQEGTHLWLDDGRGYPKKYIIEAIKELEELENRSCDNCKYWFYKTLETNIETCNFGLISHDYKSDSFCCNKWKSKNENL